MELERGWPAGAAKWRVFRERDTCSRADFDMDASRLAALVAIQEKALVSCDPASGVGG